MGVGVASGEFMAHCIGTFYVMHSTVAIVIATSK